MRSGWPCRCSLAFTRCRKGRTSARHARESRGSPFLIEELVRSNSHNAGRPEGDTLATLTLSQMVVQRMDRLTPDARLLLEVMAVGGRPLPVSVIAEASGTGERAETAIAAARARRFLRTGNFATGARSSR